MSHNTIDLRNKRFGRLTAIEPTDNRQINGQVIWKCRCRCGGWALVGTSNLTTGNTLSCGCLQKEISKVPDSKRRKMADQLRQKES